MPTWSLHYHLSLSYCYLRTRVITLMCFSSPWSPIRGPPVSLPERSGNLPGTNRTGPNRNLAVEILTLYYCTCLLCNISLSESILWYIAICHVRMRYVLYLYASHAHNSAHVSSPLPRYPSGKMAVTFHYFEIECFLEKMDRRKDLDQLFNLSSTSFFPLRVFHGHY